MPGSGIDWERERARAGQHTQRSLIALARRAGFEVNEARGKGSHAIADRPGLPRSIAIPRKVHRVLARAIIRALESGSPQ